MNELTLVIPVYNEAENIVPAVEAIRDKVKIPYEIDIVYDFDEDTTVPVVKRLMGEHPLRLVKNKYGRGALNALKTGLESAQTKYVVVTMADLCDPPETINEMFRIAEETGADIVCGSRYMKGGRQIGGPPVKSLMSRVAGTTLHWFTRVPTRDATNSFKLYRKSFLDTQTIESDGGFELGIELVAKAYAQGFKIKETPTTWTDRVAGQSNFKVAAWTPKYLHWYFHAFKGLARKK